MLEYIYFMISKNVIYTYGYSMHEKHRANLENTKKNKTKRKHKGKPNNILITKEKEN